MDGWRRAQKQDKEKPQLVQRDGWLEAGAEAGQGKAAVGAGGWRRALKPGKEKLQLVQGWLETNPRAGQKTLQLEQQRRGCKRRED
jgi:hypothetical protein